MPPDLRTLIAAELAEPVDPRVMRLAAAVAARHPGARAVLFYGSCLRDHVLEGRMVDFYLIVADYRAAYGSRLLALANRLLPPNVFPFELNGLTAKYAVLSEADFRRLCGPETDNPSVWARFAQPARIAWAADDGARAAAVDAVAQAAPTLLARTRPMMAEGAGAAVIDLWRRAFALTYAAELRPECGSRARSIVDVDPERYERVGRAALCGVDDPPGCADRARRGWRRTQGLGKLLNVARLVKASATFAGGIDYLVWKVNRHAGAGIAIRPWQRRWPVIGAFSLLPRLLVRGQVR